MNLIYLRNHNMKARKFIKSALRGSEELSIYDIEDSDCSLPAAPAEASEYLLTFLNDISPEMLDFIYGSQDWTAISHN